MLKFATVGDLHLDKPRLNDLFGRGITALKLNEVRKVYVNAKTQGIRRVIFLGDIGDGASLSDDSELQLLEFLREMDATGDFDTEVLLGNHDKEQRHVHSLCKVDWLYRHGFFKHTRVHTEHLVEQIDGVWVEFMPWPAFQPEREDSVCFAHIERPGAMRDNGGRFDENAGHPEPAGQNLWVCGHLHTPHRVGRTWFAGTLYQTSFGEQPEKRMLTARVKYDGETLTYRVRHVPHKPDFKLLTLTPETFEDLVIDPNPLIKYRILYHTDAEMPSNFMLRNPNVVECKPYRTKRELKELLVPEAVNYKVTSGLDQFLEGRGHPPAERKRAHRMIRRAGRDHNIPI